MSLWKAVKSLVLFCMAVAILVIILCCWVTHIADGIMADRAAEIAKVEEEIK